MRYFLLYINIYQFYIIEYKAKSEFNKKLANLFIIFVLNISRYRDFNNCFLYKSIIL